MNVSFIKFFAPFWKVSSDQIFDVLGFSRTGRSVWLNINGEKKIVPNTVLYTR